MTNREVVKLLEEKIIRCRMAPKINGCPMTEDWKRTIEVCEIAIDAIKAQEERRWWIPVKERLPENIGLYLVIENHWLDGSPGIKIAKWNTADWFTADRKSREITPRVTHWMPLPVPPKGDAKMKCNCGECDRRWVCGIDPDKCDEWPDPAPMTNADRIRAMRDEGLAELIVKHKPLYSWPKDVRENWMQPNVTKVQAWVTWLQQPAEGE